MSLHSVRDHKKIIHMEYKFKQYKKRNMRICFAKVKYWQKKPNDAIGDKFLISVKMFVQQKKIILFLFF